MTQFANSRDNVLDEHERATSARKCLQLLDDWPTKRKWELQDLGFFYAELRASKAFKYEPDNNTMLRLRDMVENYVTN